MKKILVPTDFSKHALYATKVAASIARKTGAKMYLLHIVNIPNYDNWNQRDHQDVAEGLFILKLVKKRFRELLQQPFLQDINVIEVLQFENIYDTIAEQSEKHEIDLIVMGSHGTSGWKEDFVGSNTEKVVRTVSCPVLTIKQDYENFEMKNMVFASNFYGEANQSFEALYNLAQVFDSKIHLLKVITPINFETTLYSEKLITDFIAENNLKNVSINSINAESIEKGINDFCSKIEADIIAMETHGRKGISHFFNGSITEEVVNHSSLPILSIKIKQPVKA